MQVLHSVEAEKSLFDLHCTLAPGERLPRRPAVFEWFGGDGATLEAKSDEHALASMRAFLELWRAVKTATGEQAELSGLSVSLARIWAHLLGRTVLFMPTDRLREAQAQMVCAGEVDLVRGGDRNSVTGAAVPLTYLFKPPFTDQWLSGCRPEAWAVTFARGSAARHAVHTGDLRGLKEETIGMNFLRDVDYGTRGEKYLARLLQGFAARDTRIELVRSHLAVTRPRGAQDWGDPELQMAWQRNGELVGIAASDADLWVIDFGGLVMVCPVADLRELARQTFKERRDEALQGDPATRVLRVPFQEWVPSEKFGTRNSVTGLFAMSGSRLPVGLESVPELDRVLFETAPTAQAA